MSQRRSRRPSQNKGEVQTLSKTEGEVQTLKIDLPSKEILNQLPENLRQTVIQAASFKGPIPPPSMLSAYEQVLPGSGDRIVKMAEREQDHRHVHNDTTLAAMIRDMKRVHWISLAVALTAIVGAVVVSIFGNPYVAGMLGGTTLLGTLGSILSSVLNRSNAESGS